MGTNKLFLTVDGEPLLRRTVRVLLEGGVTQVIVVLADDSPRALLDGLPRTAILVNPSPERGMLSSVQVALRSLPSGSDWLVCPVDLPKLKPTDVAAVLSLSEGRSEIVVPVFAQKRGHPTWFSTRFTTAALALDPEVVGLNRLLADNASAVTEVVVAGDGPIRDIDTPEDWKAMQLDLEDDLPEIPADVEAILQRQDEALALLERLRAQEPYRKPKTDARGARRREFRRWPLPDGVTLELHDGDGWQVADCLDMGVGGTQLGSLARFADGPTPGRLKAPATPAILVLCDVMWKDREGKAGLRFEFRDDDERDLWSGGLIDALLARHAVS